MESRRARRLLFLRPFPASSSSSVHFRGELPDVSSRQEVHHPFIALLHGEQLRDLHVSASARSPSRCFPHLFPERLLLVVVVVLVGAVISTATPVVQVAW